MNLIDKMLIEPFLSFYERVLQFLPNLLTSLLLLFIGIVLGMILYVVFSRFFRTLNIDKFTERLETMELLHKGGIKDPASILLAKAIKWVVIISFIIISLRALNIPALEHLLEKFFLYLPNVFVAAIILFLGSLLGNFFGRAALIASVNAGLRISGLIARFVKYIVFILAVTMALEQLGIGKETVIIAFAIIFGGVVLAFAIAFGIGGKEAAKEYIEKRLKGEVEAEDFKHL